MSCYAIHRSDKPTGRVTVLVFPSEMLRSTYVTMTENKRGPFEDCTAREAYKYIRGTKRVLTDVLDMRMPEHWDKKPFDLALERHLGDQFV